MNSLLRNGEFFLIYNFTQIEKRPIFGEFRKKEIKVSYQMSRIRLIFVSKGWQNLRILKINWNSTTKKENLIGFQKWNEPSKINYPHEKRHWKLNRNTFKLMVIREVLLYRESHENLLVNSDIMIMLYIILIYYYERAVAENKI